MVASCVFGALALLLLLWGIQLIRGRLLDTIAGNNSVSKAKRSEPGQVGLGRRVGRAMVSAGALTFLLSLSLLFDELGFHGLSELFLSLTYVSIIPLLVFVALSFSWSLRHMK